jgi:dTDP-4-amino-4,6-dideoxygalactose transaminase
MDVLPFGAEPRLPEWYHKADFVLIDGAASFDALKEVGQSDIMSDRVAIVVSLHSTKLMGGGEGGIVLSKNTELITKIKAWQNFGFDLNNSRTRTSNFIGTNAKMSEYSCAVALASLDNWGENRENYLGISRTARAICTELGFEIHPAMKRGLATPNWILIPRDQSQSQKIEIAFDSAKFETRKWWNDGCHKMYAFSGYANEALPNTESLAGRYIGLPFHLYLPNEYWNRVHDLLSKCSTSA